MDTDRLRTRLRAVPPRRRRALALLGALALVALLVVGGILRWPPSGTAALPGCGPLPTSDGAHRDTIQAVLSAPAAAAAGSQVQGTVTVSTGGATVNFVSGPPELLVVLGDRVVGRYRGDTAAVGVGGEIGPAGLALGASGRLSSCLSALEQGLLGRADVDREPLPPGLYSLVGRMSDDGQNDHDHSLVTNPVPITVTA